MKLKKIIYLLVLLLFIPFCTVEASSARCYLEYPSDNALLGDVMYVQGWMMSDDKNSYIEIFVDDELVKTDINRVVRNDVLSAISGYGGNINNPFPGFMTSLDLKDYSHGRHSVKMVVYDGLGMVLADYTKTFVIDDTLGRMYLDYPKEDSFFGDNLVIEGWVMSTVVNGEFHVYIDNKEIDFSISRRERPDVIAAISGYGDKKTNVMPGFSLESSLSSISDGTHQLTVAYTKKSGEVLTSQSKNIYIKKDMARMYLDYPGNHFIFDDELFINGWIMSTNQNGSFQLFVDDVSFEFEITRRARPDVLKAIFGYGDEKTNPTPGFSIQTSLKEISDGNHKVTLKYVNSLGEVLEEKFTEIQVQKNIGRMYLDYPKESNVSDTLNISGWIVTPNQNYQLLLYVDSKLVDTTFQRRSRVDVVEAIPGYGDIILNSEPGFSTVLDLSGYLDGSHYIEVVALSDDGVEITKVRKDINLSKYTARSFIDRPGMEDEFFGTELLVRGWALSDCIDHSIQVYIDDQYIQNIDNRTSRVDVLDAFGYLYGVQNQNANPGYEGLIDVTKIKDGNHEISVKVVNEKTNEVLSVESKNIYLKKYNSHLILEKPIGNFEINGTNLEVKGWYLTDALNSSFKFYVDNQLVDIYDFVREEKLDIPVDVLSIYEMTSQNVKPGFYGKIDLTSLNDGIHTIRVDVVNDDTGEILVSNSRKISLKKYISDMYIDYPKDNVNGISIDLSGWVLTNAPSTELKFLIDNEEVVVTDSYRRTRVDVLEVFKDKYSSGFPNEKPGYGGIVDLSLYKDGIHEAKVLLVNTVNGEVLNYSSKSFSLKKSDGMISFEYPKKSNFSNQSQLYIQGFELSDTADSIIKVYFDDKELEVIREERADVLNAYPNSYGGALVNVLPGFHSTYDLNSVSSGEHTLRIELYSSYGDLIATSEKKIIVYDNMYFGIDVSSHQGKINWKEVKKSGIDFAILRLGYGDNFERQDDSMFFNNVNGCVENDIPYGVYLYSYAIHKNGVSELNRDSESIDSEIAHTLRVLNSLTLSQKQNLKLSVFLDMEDSSTVHLGKKTLTDMADYYCTNIQKSGYSCGIYANKSWLNNYLDASYLENKYDIWLAHYTGDYHNFSDYSGIYNIWQYTSSGSLNGIYSDGLDMNISMKKYW